MTDPTNEQLEAMDDERLNGQIEEHERRRQDPWHVDEALSDLGDRDYLVPHDLVEEGYGSWLAVTNAARKWLDFPTDEQVEAGIAAMVNEAQRLDDGLIPTEATLTAIHLGFRKGLEAVRDTMIGDNQP